MRTDEQASDGKEIGTGIPATIDDLDRAIMVELQDDGP
jgi:hypothetical protein